MKIPNKLGCTRGNYYARILGAMRVLVLPVIKVALTASASGVIYAGT